MALPITCLFMDLSHKSNIREQSSWVGIVAHILGMLFSCVGAGIAYLIANIVDIRNSCSSLG